MRDPKPNYKLQAVRDRKVWTLEEAAEAIGVDVQTFWRWENSVHRPRQYALRKLIQVFGVPAEELGFGRSPGTVDHTQPAEEMEQDEALPPTAPPARTLDSSIITLTPGQVDAFLALLEDETTMKRFDPAKRETLRTLRALFRDAALAGSVISLFGERLKQEISTDPEPWERLAVAHAKPLALNKATLNRFVHLLGECWEPSNQNELEASEGILSSFLPKMLALAPRDVDSSIAYIASQGLRLHSVLVHHRSRGSQKILICQQAVDYALHAHDANTLVTALIELAAAFKFEGQFEQRLSTLQEALGYSVQASPLVQSRAYSNTASALAESGRIQEAQLYMQLAQDIFPDDPSNDPGFALADSSIFTLSYHAGKVYACAGKSAEAFDAFELYKRRALDINIPERIRLEIVNAQSRTAIQANDLERYAHCFEEALIGAVTLGSKKRFDEALTIFHREMPKTWLANGHIKGMVEKYHLERKG
jgi:transcriptional regulator with XRE-family HTH domain